MSTFNGKITELPHISVDCFEDFDSNAYFLSHCHADHMRGLSYSKFHDNLIKENVFIYSSHISCEILRRQYPILSSQLKELDLYSSTSIQVKDYVISVSPIPAGHCPGSVMFLFENGKTILYTGDYRIDSKDFKKIRLFYSSFNQLKTIDKVYLDTTFFLKSYQNFPTRKESLDEICRIIKGWISRSTNHTINLATSAKYGYEYLLIEIYKQLNKPIHVNEEIYKFYCLVPEMDKTITRIGENTQIHLSYCDSYPRMCPNTYMGQMKTIKISALRWKNDQLQNGITEENDLSYTSDYVCYATHASYEEGMEFLKFLMPKEISACVWHKNVDYNCEITQNIKDFLATSKGNQDKSKLFKIKDTKQVEQTESGETSKFVCILESPPRKKRLPFN